MLLGQPVVTMYSFAYDLPPMSYLKLRRVIGTPALAHTYGWPVMLWICSYMVVATGGMGLIGKRVAEIGEGH